MSRKSKKPPSGQTMDGLNKIIPQLTKQMDILQGLEQKIRGVVSDNLSITDSLSEIKTTLDTFMSKMGELDISNKGILQQFYKRDAENQKTLLQFRQHYTREIKQLEETLEGILRDRIVESLLNSFLPLLQDLDHCLVKEREHGSGGDSQRLINTIESFRKKYFNVLRQLDFSEMEIIEGHTPFDPQFHEAVQPDYDEQIPDKSEIQPGIILKIKSNGYLYKNKLFLPPKVIVKGGKNHEQPIS